MRARGHTPSPCFSWWWCRLQVSFLRSQLQDLRASSRSLAVETPTPRGSALDAIPVRRAEGTARWVPPPLLPTTLYAPMNVWLDEGCSAGVCLDGVLGACRVFPPHPPPLCHRAAIHRAFTALVDLLGTLAKSPAKKAQPVLSPGGDDGDYDADDFETEEGR